MPKEIRKTEYKLNNLIVRLAAENKTQLSRENMEKIEAAEDCLHAFSIGKDPAETMIKAKKLLIDPDWIIFPWYVIDDALRKRGLDVGG